MLTRLPIPCKSRHDFRCRSRWISDQVCVWVEDIAHLSLEVGLGIDVLEYLDGKKLEKALAVKALSVFEEEMDDREIERDED